MKPCYNCGELKVSTDDAPRYDVLNPVSNPDDPSTTPGPFCEDCFELTVTGKAITV